MAQPPASTARTSFLDTIRSTFSGWFNPGQPLTPTAPPDTPVRAFDYPITQNMNWTPRNREPIGFQQLKNMADACYLMRVVIENVKDRISSRAWHLRLKSEPGEVRALADLRGRKDPRIGILTDFFAFPDGIHTFREWFRELLEQCIVLDAATLEVQRNRAGQVINLILVDGSTITPMIDSTGRMPRFPLPAYQQVVHGLATTDLTERDLLYMVRNRRTHKVYGFSPVEQTIMLILTVVMRTEFQFESYNSGNMPAAFLPVSKDMGVDEVTRLMSALNAKLSGDNSERNKMYPYPAGTGSIVFPKERDLFAEFDEWAAKVFCFALGETASPLTKQTNRASSQQNDDTRKETGEMALMNWWQDQMNKMLQSPSMLNAPDIEFVWDDETDADPLKQAQVDQIYVSIGKITPDELRERDGQPPLTQEQKDELKPPPLPKPMGGFDQAEEGGDEPPEPGGAPPSGKKPKKNDDQAAGTNKVAKAEKKKTITINPDALGPQAKKAEAAIAGILTQLFEQQASVAGAAIAKAYGRTTKADDDPDLDAKVDEVLAAYSFEPWTAVISKIADELDPVGAEAVVDVFGQLELTEDTYDSLFKLGNTAARDYAQARAAELVGMKYTADGSLIVNPNPRWAITDTTRNTLRGIITQAYEQKLSPAQIATSIEESVSFGAARAQLIAQTETNFAATAAAVATGKGYGAVGKSVQMSNEHDIDDVCDAAAKLGVIGIDDEYPSGDEHVPLHPGCKCIELLHYKLPKQK